MKNLDEFLNHFRNGEYTVPYSITNQIKNFTPNQKQKYKFGQLHFFKKSIVVTSALLLSSGIVLAATKTYETIWKQPEKYEFSYELTENEKQEAISEEEARKKASEYLMKIGLKDEINSLSLDKNVFENKVIWNIGFENGSMRINHKGEFESLNIPSYQYKIPYNYAITREEARKVAKELLAKYNPQNNDDAYELVSLKRNGDDEYAYIWYATFYKKYDDLINMYEKIDIGWIPTINGLYSLSIENDVYENNEQLISKEDAINIAVEKDKQIETRYPITSTEAEIGIDKMNTEVVYRQEDLEEYEKGTIHFIPEGNGKVKLKEDAVFYKVDNRVRKVWEVTIYYDKYDNETQKRYVYLVDATTGEIIGGNRWAASTKQIRDLMSDPYNVIEK